MKKQIMLFAMSMYCILAAITDMENLIGNFSSVYATITLVVSGIALLASIIALLKKNQIMLAISGVLLIASDVTAFLNEREIRESISALNDSTTDMSTIPIIRIVFYSIVIISGIVLTFLAKDDSNEEESKSYIAMKGFCLLVLIDCICLMFGQITLTFSPSFSPYFIFNIGWILTTILTIAVLVCCVISLRQKYNFVGVNLSMTYFILSAVSCLITFMNFGMYSFGILMSYKFLVAGIVNIILAISLGIVSNKVRRENLMKKFYGPEPMQFNPNLIVNNDNVGPVTPDQQQPVADQQDTNQQ